MMCSWCVHGCLQQPMPVLPTPVVGAKLCEVPLRQLQKQQYPVGMKESASGTYVGKHMSSARKCIGTTQWNTFHSFRFTRGQFGATNELLESLPAASIFLSVERRGIEAQLMKGCVSNTASPHSLSTQLVQMPVLTMSIMTF
jgi:hypothetical protein